MTCADEVFGKHTVQTAFVAVLGLGGPGLTKSLWASTAVAPAGIALSTTWWLRIKSYRDLNRAKSEIINKIEEQLPVKVFSGKWAALNAIRCGLGAPATPNWV